VAVKVGVGVNEAVNVAVGSGVVVEVGVNESVKVVVGVGVKEAVGVGVARKDIGALQANEISANTLTGMIKIFLKFTSLSRKPRAFGVIFIIANTILFTSEISNLSTNF
jgi:hypothetical protein